MPPSVLILSIGGLSGHFRLGPLAGFFQKLRARYDSFLVPPAPWVSKDFSLELDWEDAAPGLETPEARVEGGAVHVRRWDFEARLEDGRGRGRCRPDVYSFDSFLRVLWSVYLAKNGGALVHAAGVRVGNSAVLFPGMSEAGKTTLARKVEDREAVLSDEITPVRRDAEGRWLAYHSPFWGEFGSGPGSLRAYPLAAVAFPVKTPELRVAPLSPADASQRLLGTILCFEQGPAAARAQLEIAARLATEVPAFEAGTRLDTPAAALFERLPNAAPHRTPGEREVISELRAQLKSRGRCAIVSTGGSMRPAVRSGDTLFIQATPEVAVGDVVAYWRPGETPEGDKLLCHRLMAPRNERGRFLTKGDTLSRFETFVDGAEGELLGKVVALSRKGKTRALTGGVVKALASLAVAPVVHLREALR